MEKVKLSEMIIYYETKKEKKDSDFGDYFEEKDIEKKLSRLKLMQETVGDLELPLNQIRAFLYAGQQYQNKNEFQLTKPMIKDVTEILKEQEEMPTKILLKLLDSYDEECYKEYDIKGEINKLVAKEKYSDEVTEKIYATIKVKKEELKKFYEEESIKLEILKDQYNPSFIELLQKKVAEKHIKSEDIIKLIPSPEFIENSKVRVDLGYDIKSGEDIVWKMIEGYVNLDDYEDEEKINLGMSATGKSYVYTSFTKKEYLEEIKKDKKQKR